jgi:hypothetical protein
MRRPWIKIETATPDKPEICAIATQLRMDTDMVVGKLIRLWSWITVNKVSGNDLGVTKEFLDKLVGRKGFADALESAGWLLVTKGKLSMPHFERHNSDAAKVRALTAQRVKRHRITRELRVPSSDAGVTSTLPIEGCEEGESLEEVIAGESLTIPEVVSIDTEIEGANVDAERAVEGVESQIARFDIAPEKEGDQTGEALSINAEPTFRPLDFEDPPVHEKGTEEPVVKPEAAKLEVPPVRIDAGVEVPTLEPVPVKKSKRKADGKEDDQPLLF